VAIYVYAIFNSINISFMIIRLCCNCTMKHALKDGEEKEQMALKMCQGCNNFLDLMMTTGAYMKLVCIGSIMNKIRNITYPDSNLVITLKGIIAITSLNVFIAVIKYLVNTHTQTFKWKALCFIPLLIFSGVLFLKPFASFMLFYYTQQYFTNENFMELNYYENIALANAIIAFSSTLYMYLIIIAFLDPKLKEWKSTILATLSCAPLALILFNLSALIIIRDYSGMGFYWISDIVLTCIYTVLSCCVCVGAVKYRKEAKQFQETLLSEWQQES